LSELLVVCFRHQDPSCGVMRGGFRGSHRSSSGTYHGKGIGVDLRKHQRLRASLCSDVLNAVYALQNVMCVFGGKRDGTPSMIPF
jgi:hypothetical protein